MNFQGQRKCFPFFLILGKKEMFRAHKSINFCLKQEKINIEVFKDIAKGVSEGKSA